MSVSVGQIISQTFATVKERFWSLLGLWLIFFAAQLVLMMFLGGVMGAAGMAGLATGRPAMFGSGMFVGILAFYIVYFLIYCAQLSSLVAMASPLQRPSFGESLNAGLRSAPTMLAVFILLVIAWFAVALLLGLVGGVLANASGTVAAVLSLLLIPAAIYVLCRLSMVQPVVAVDRIGNPVTAITRSWSIAKGNVLTIFLSFLILGLGAILAMALLFSPIYSSMTSAVTSAAMAGGGPGFGVFVFAFVGLIVFGVVFSIIAAALFSVIHSELAGATGQNVSEVFY